MEAFLILISTCIVFYANISIKSNHYCFGIYNEAI